MHFHLDKQQKVQFRAEVFNMLNHPQFGPPDANLATPASFGNSMATISNLGGFGSNRQIQFGIRYSF